MKMPWTQRAPQIDDLLLPEAELWEGLPVPPQGVLHRCQHSDHQTGNSGFCNHCVNRFIRDNFEYDGREGAEKTLARTKERECRFRLYRIIDEEFRLDYPALQPGLYSIEVRADKTTRSEAKYPGMIYVVRGGLHDGMSGWLRQEGIPYGVVNTEASRRLREMGIEIEYDEVP